MSTAAPEMVVFDFSRKAGKARRAKSAPGLDFPTADGGTVRLLYPAMRYRPAGPDPDDPKRVLIGLRFGYPAPVQAAADRFRATWEDPTADDAAVFAAAVGVALAQLRHGGSESDPDLFEMDFLDATIFVARVARLILGLPDLERDPDGAYLFEPPAEDLDATAEPEPIEN